MYKKIVFCWRLEGQWQKKDPNPDPLVRGPDPDPYDTKMSWIRNTACHKENWYYNINILVKKKQGAVLRGANVHVYTEYLLMCMKWISLDAM